MQTPSATRRLAVGVVVAGTAVAVAALAPAAQAATHHTRHEVAGSKPAWTSGAKQIGSTKASSTVSFGMLLGMRHSAAAAAQIQRLSDPKSADYGKWLTNKQFNATYAPTAASVHAVQAWLHGQGFRIAKTLRSGMLIEVSGSAGKVEKTFGTTLKQYSYRGHDVRGNTSALTFAATTPAAVTSAVAGVVGVDQGAEIKTPTDTEPGPPPGARYGVQPCSAYYGQKVATDKPSYEGQKWPYAVCGYLPKQLESAYGETSLINKGIDGRGVTVAITDAYAAPTILSDANTYSTNHGLPAFAKGQFSQITPDADGYDDESDCGPQGWYGEETLDVEAVHTMAPGAKVVYVGAADCEESLNEVWADAIDSHVANVISDSWSDGTDSLAQIGQSDLDLFNQYSAEAALTGITVNFSSGDDGDLTEGGTELTQKTVGFPADEPYVTGVGGTSIAIDKSGQRTDEWGWSNAYSQLVTGASSHWGPRAYSSGSGGGTSELFAQPFYQRGAVPTSISEYYGSNPARAVPDISMVGDPNTGFEVGETQVFPNGTYYSEYRIGGTSVSSPLLAGAVAVADQAGKRSIGFANPLYYELAGTSSIYDVLPRSGPVHQVRTNFANGVNRSMGYTYELQTIDDEETTLHVTKGYDDITGVGTPGGPAFFTGLATAARNAG